MSELETRVGESLTGVADRALHPTDLATGARSRLRRRRRTTAAVVTVTVAVAAVPVALTLVGNPADVPTEDSTVAETPFGWRTETWRDLSVSVPPDWTYGGGTDWCADGQESPRTGPQVSRPGVVPAIDCAPDYRYGAHFLQPSGGELPPGTEGAVQQYHGDHYPDGAWIGYASTQSSAVWVVTADRSTTRQVLDSATPVGEVDANGCASRFEMTAPSGAERLSVCRYDGEGWLEQSELLSPTDSEAARDAVEAAPASSCQPPPPGAETITLHSAGFGFQVAFGKGCAVITDDAGTVKQVTPEILHWALSPGWSGSASFLTYDHDPEPLDLRRP